MSQQGEHFKSRREDSADKVEDYLSSRPELADYLARTKYITYRKVADHTGVPDHEAQGHIRYFGKTMMIEDRGTHGYFVTNELKAIAKKVAANTTINYDYEEEVL